MLATISLRALRAGDRDVIAGLLARAGNFNAAEQAVGCELADYSLANPGQTDYRFAIAEDDGRPVGYACWGLASLSDGSWELYWVAVDPDCRGRGVGRILVEHCEDDVRTARGRSLVAETSSRSGYEGTLAFYRKLNYEILGRIRDFYTAGDDKVILGKYFPL
ncbi:MAG: GNAT family N-acetyltransferase [Planctomycetes bacterium]|nr:GNAT family N-acetyltransferase [Planctomycetota bacterium]